MNWCKRCVYPEVAVDFSFNDEGICSGCLNKDEIKNIDWDKKIVPRIKIGDWVSFHWGMVAQALSSKEVASLKKHTQNTLKIL